MAKFLVLYRSAVSAREQVANATPEQKKAGMDAWMAWAKQNEGAVVDLGSPLGDGRSVGGSGASQTLSGYSIMEAESEAAVVERLKDHPHLHMPGDSSIDVFEFLAMPGT